MLRVLADANKPEDEVMAKAGEILRRGGLVAFPTETVYGLGADALNRDAVAKVYKVKGRPSDNPLIWHANRLEDFIKYADFNPMAYKLAQAFWPGPFTMVLAQKTFPKKQDMGTGFIQDEKQSIASSNAVSNTVAIRVPSHPVTRALIAASGCIIAAPSANLSGRPSPTCARHVMEDFKNSEIDMIIDGGQTYTGLESTVADLSLNRVRLLRPGAVTLEMLQAAAGEVEVPLPDISDEAAPLSPGMKYRHYAPKVPLILIVGSPQAVSAEIKKYKNAGILRTYKKNPEEVARTLFGCLRQFDEKKVEVILAEGIQEEGIGLAVMNRLKKAAEKIVYV